MLTSIYDTIAPIYKLKIVYSCISENRLDYAPVADDPQQLSGLI